MRSISHRRSLAPCTQGVANRPPACCLASGVVACDRRAPGEDAIIGCVDADMSVRTTA